MDLESNGPHDSVNPISEEFRSLVNTNSRGSSEITAKTVRMINCEINNQVTRKLDETKMDLNCQIFEANNSAITEETFPIILNTLVKQEK